MKLTSPSRLKDFYDLWQIAQSFGFQQPRLLEAIQQTFEQRGTPLPIALPVGLSDNFATAWSAQWRAFLGRERMATAPKALGSVVADLRKFLMPLIDASEGDRVWPPGGPWAVNAAAGSV